jgi:hypothetical protein
VLDYSHAIAAAALAMYDPGFFPLLATGPVEASHGDGSTLLQFLHLIGVAAGRLPGQVLPDPVYENENDAFCAVFCTDTAITRSRREFVAPARSASRVAPAFGAVWSYQNGAECVTWPARTPARGTAAPQRRCCSSGPRTTR